MELLYKYIKQRRCIIASGFFCCFIFVISFYLYHLPVVAVIYPSIICIVFGLLFSIFDFFRIKRKCDILDSIYDITDTITVRFPQVECIEEDKYQQIIRRISNEYQKYRVNTKQEYCDMIDYYSVWVHQIKTPIASMHLQLQNEDTTLSRKLSMELLRIEQYVEMVLTFVRLNTEGTDYLIKEYDLDLIIKNVIKKLSCEFIEKEIKLIYKPVKTRVITDEKWLSFVIEQVLSNALKYTFIGSVTIMLTSDKKLCICDTGIGIAAEDLPRIFEKGYTGYNGRVDKKASGIGLYLAKRICTNLGHYINATSEINVGTNVTIEFFKIKPEIE